MQLSGGGPEAARRVNDRALESNGAGLCDRDPGRRHGQKTCYHQPAGNPGGHPVSLQRFHVFTLSSVLVRMHAASEAVHLAPGRVRAATTFIMVAHLDVLRGL
ncbi:hypothetical protein D3C72_1991540 [compost metagenome]